MKKSGNVPSKNKNKAGARSRRQQSLPVVLIAVGVLVLAVVLVIALTAGGQGEAQAAVQPARVGARLNDFSLVDISGQRVSLSDFRGQVVVLNAWATWCPPCRAEMPALNAYYQAHREEGFVILAINAGDAAADAAAFAKSYNLAFPVLLDPDLALLDGLQVHSFPTSILIGRDGVIKDIHIGLFTPEQIEAKISPLLNQ